MSSGPGHCSPNLENQIFVEDKSSDESESLSEGDDKNEFVTKSFRTKNHYQTPSSKIPPFLPHISSKINPFLKSLGPETHQ